MAQKKGLGKGLGALLPSAPETENVVVKDENISEARAGVMEVDINQVEPNKDQPRKYFEDTALQELAESIRTFGIIQPLLVKKEDGFFSIIAGERRWRAARLAKLTKVPVIVREYNDSDLLQVALIENIQRADLNPLEESLSYKRLSEDYGMTQDEIAQRVGKSRSAIANMLRLLKLDKRVQSFLADNRLTVGHARALLPLEEDMQLEVAERIMEDELSVRETEALIQTLQEEKNAPAEAVTTPDGKAKTARRPHIEGIEGNLKQLLGTKVSIKEKDDKGKIEIQYFSQEDLDRLLCLFKQIES